VTTTPDIAAPVLAASRGEPARTVPLIVAVVPALPPVDGLVGELDAPPHADTASAKASSAEKEKYFSMNAPGPPFAGPWSSPAIRMPIAAKMQIYAPGRVTKMIREGSTGAFTNSL